MLIDEYLQDLQKVTHKKPPTYEKVAQVLNLGSKQAVSNRIYRKQHLKDFEIGLLDAEFKNNQSTQNGLLLFEDNLIKIPYWEHLPEELRISDFTCVTAERGVIKNHWNLNPEALRIIPMVGDKLTNYWYRINDNDILIIDTAHNFIRGNGVYFATSRNNTRFWIREMQALINDDIQIKGYAPSGDTIKVFTQQQLVEVDFQVIGKVIKNVSFRL